MRKKEQEGGPEGPPAGKEPAVKVTQHPNGFLKVVIADEADGSSLRFHAWDDHVPDTIDIHQHRGDIEYSTVLEGSMNEELWTYADDPGGEWERMQVRCWTDEQGNYHVDEHSPRVRCRPEIAELLTHKAGETYCRPATDLHRVFPVKLPLVTLVRFGKAYNEIHTMIRKI